VGVHRRPYRVGVLVGVALLASGVVVGWRGYAATSGPAGAVRGYFAAIARADAANALAFGNVPDGPHVLLTAAVLREQQRIAPLRRVTVHATHRHGSAASVDVTYTLAFSGRAVPIRVSVPVHESDGDWRLDRSAVATELETSGARQRETILGAGVPAGPTLVFPGAVPIRFDSPYLQLDPASDSVSFDASPVTDLHVQPTAAARSAMLAAVRSKLRGCLSGPADPACPLPDERYVPGSIRGAIKGELRAKAVQLNPLDPVGTLELRAGVTVTGTSRRLDFDNRQVPGPTTMDLIVHAVAYAVAPLAVRWAST
jgi:hypothetical protein